MKMTRLAASIIVCIMIAGSFPMSIGIAAGDTGSRDTDNSFATATPVVSDDKTIVSTFNAPNDIWDYYKIQLNNSGAGNAEKLVVNATSFGSVGQVIKLSIYDPETYWIVVDIDSFGTTSYLEVIPEWSGWYYVILEGQGSPEYSYSIRFQKTTVPWTGDTNTDASNATVMSTFPYNTTKTYNNKTDPQDFYKVHLEKVAGSYIDMLMVKFTPPTGVNQQCVIEVYWASNDTGVPGWFNQKGSGFITNPMGKIFTFAPKVTGDYLLRMWGYQNISSYGFNAIKVRANIDTNVDKDSAVSVLGTGKTHEDNAVESAGYAIDDNDFFKFNGKKGMHVNATLFSSDYNPEMNLPVFYLHLINSSDYEYAEAELDVIRMTADPEAVIEGSVPKNDTYYFWVECLGGAGNYRLNITANTPPQAVQASVIDPGYEMFIWENGTNSSLKLNDIFVDYDGDPMTYSVDTNPDMTVTINPTTTVATFTPRAGFKGYAWMNLTATDDQGGKGTLMVKTHIYGVNHAPFIKKQFNETISGGVLVMKTGTINTTINLMDYFADYDKTDKHWFTVQGNDKVQIFFQEESPVTPNHYRTGIMTIIAPSTEVVENVQFYCKDNGWPQLTSPALNLTIQTSTGEIRMLSKPGGELKFNEDGVGTFPVKDYIYFKPPAPKDDTIEFTAESPVNLTVTIADGVATITPSPSDWCGNGVVKFTGTGVKNTKATNTTNVKVTVICVNDAPVLVDYTPKGNVSVAEGQKVEFKVTATDPDTAVTSLKYKWFLDGLQQASVAPTFTYSPTFESAGKHNVSVTINDTELVISYLWDDVTVTNVNRAPANVRVVEPLNNTNFTQGKKISLKAGTATDPDGDTLEYKWYDNDVQIGNTQNIDAYKLAKKGKHVIKLVVSDGKGAQTTDQKTINVKAKKTQPGFDGVIAIMAIMGAIVVMVAIGARRKK